jgi:hypothetical protein
MAKNAGVTVFFILLGGIIGGYIGVLLGLLVPAGTLREILGTGFPIGFTDPVVLNLRLVILTFGLKIFINLFSVIGMVLGFYYAK